ncbi:GntR family transcriptional regulator [Lacticaseibacillus hegangensis]|uniref:GntR family transcriptional regulator n=1 Tax=Lacticaseibacillus hegangensis TaxID=2486010 RepID=A0ABW4CTJ1_9LACO|nr:GntR family transcriptional regulator [Lacticaseibacillus hegangensis]
MATKSGKIFDDLKGQILDGVYKDQKKLPTEQALVTYYGASRNTIRNVLKELEVEGLIYSIQGSGYYSQDAKVLDSILLRGLSELSRAKTQKDKVTAFAIEKSSHELSQLFKIDLGSPIIHFCRQRFLNKKLVQYEDAYMPQEMFPDFTKKDASGPIYNYVETHGYRISYVVREDRDILLTDEQKTHLGLPEDKPSAAMLTRSTNYLEDGRVFEYSEIIEHHAYHTHVARRH